MMSKPRSLVDDREVEVDPACLRPGMFVRLGLGWMDHPFMFNQFRIASEDQVREIQALGLSKIAYLPGKSLTKPYSSPPSAASKPATVSPSPVAAGATPPEGETVVTAAQSAGDSPDASPIDWSASSVPVHRTKAESARKLAAVRARIEHCERAYLEAADQVRDVMRLLDAHPQKALSSARAFLGEMVSSFEDAQNPAVHLMNEKLSSEAVHFHTINVMVLSLLLGRDLNLPTEVLRALAEGALLHDIGKSRVPESILRNPERNRHEEEFYRLHTAYGVEMAQGFGGCTPAVLQIIEQHHEHMDGKGFPKGLGGKAISLLARIVGIANRFDNLCNPVMLARSVTPAEAMAQMLRDEPAKWDRALLHRFIRILGVYPPGSLVQMSNGNIGLVVSIDQSDLLRPTVMVFDPHVPRSEAIVIDLTQESDVRIDAALKPQDLSPDALGYLAPRRRLSYFKSGPQQGAG